MPRADVDPWESLEPAWRQCFLLAWESFRAGSVPVGAVIVDGAGSVVATGRNRRNERPGPDGQLAGCNLAHAEVNALAALPPGDYGDHTLFSTLEPCLLCTAALRYSHMGTVRFAAPDPMWYGIDRLPELNHHLARRWPRRTGPLDGPLGTFGAVLHLFSALERGVGSIVDAHVDTMPDALRVARHLFGPGVDHLRALTLDQAIHAASRVDHREPGATTA